MGAFRRTSINVYDGSGFEIAEEKLFESVYDGDDRAIDEQFDPWLYTETDEKGNKLGFKILGTSHDDVSCQPHVLSPIQMINLQPHLPNSKRGESYWLKYSLVRDGASAMTFLQNVRGSTHTLLATETIDGEVFGGFFSNTWAIQNSYFGTGESFLWKMKTRRTTDIFMP